PASTDELRRLGDGDHTGSRGNHPERLAARRAGAPLVARATRAVTGSVEACPLVGSGAGSGAVGRFIRRPPAVAPGRDPPRAAPRSIDGGRALIMAGSHRPPAIDSVRSAHLVGIGGTAM